MLFDLIIFDVDGVLIKTSYVKLIFPKIARRLVEESRVRKFVSMMVNESLKRMRKGDLVGAYNWDDIIRAISDEMGVKGEVSFLETIDETLSSSNEIRAYEDVIPTLSKLKEKNIRLLALTNGFYDVMKLILTKTGVFELLDDLITPDRVGFAKPSPLIFLEASKGARRSLFVGDRVSVDICGANSAGIESALLWRDLSILIAENPRERAIKAAQANIIAKKLREEKTSFLAHPKFCYPDFLIRSLNEIFQILEEST